MNSSLMLVRYEAKVVLVRQRPIYDGIMAHILETVVL